MQHRASTGVALVMVGAGLAGLLSVALLPMVHPVRVVVQNVSIAVIAIAVTVLLLRSWKGRS